MFDSIIQKDKQLSVFLNNLGSEQWDSFWLGITNQFYWAPLFIFILFLVVKTFGWKRGGVMILAMILLVTISDQLTVFIKDNTFRLRPNNDPEIMDSLRTSLREFTNPQSHSFMSGHATTSTFFSLFTIFLLRERYKQIYFILVFPLFFAYSRLYLGVHFPSDVFIGILLGILLANIYYFFFKKLDKKLFL